MVSYLMRDNVFPLFKRCKTAVIPLASKKPYQAFATSSPDRDRPETFLLFEGLSRDPDLRLMLSYIYLMDISCTAGEYLSLMYSNVIVTLEGRNLSALLEPLQNSRLRTLQCYIPERHFEPSTTDGGVIIYNITSLSIDNWWKQYLENQAKWDAEQS